MSKPIEGKPAFPHGPLEVYDDTTHRWSSLDAKPGMSERRWYIGQALAGFNANPKFAVMPHDAIALMAVNQADAVMQQLYPQPKETEQ